MLTYFCIVYSLFQFRLEVRQAAEGFHHVPGIVEAKVENIKEAWDVLQAGSNARSVGSNNVNEHSSRSHWSVAAGCALFVLVFLIMVFACLYA